MISARTRIWVPVVLATLLALAALGCDGKPCSEPPDYAEADEEVRDAIDDLLDDGDVHEKQKERILALNESLAPARAKLRAKREILRAKIIDELVAVKPEPKQLHAHIEALRDVIMPYAYAGVGMALDAHRMLTAEQRDEIAKTWEEPPDEYTGSWAMNRAIDAALLKIDATDAQKALVESWRDRMVKKTDALLKDQHAVRLDLLVQWRAKKPDPTLVRSHVDRAADQIGRFVHLFADAAMEITAALTPQQRMWTNQQVNRLRRCPQ